MPRLSVDIDVAYSNQTKKRDEALDEIALELHATERRRAEASFESEMVSTKNDDEVKLLARRARSLIKVEVYHVFRSTVLPLDTRRLSGSLRDLLATELSAPMLAVLEFYGSKLPAAMDRQHTRDLFDVCGMYRVAA